MQGSQIIVVGSSNTDLVVVAERLPTPGETILGGDFFLVAGGKGANQAVAASRLGTKVAFIARIGKDLFGDQAIKTLSEEGLDLTYLVRDDDYPSGVALIMVGAGGENLIAVSPGANQQLSSRDVARASPAFNQARIVLLQLEIPFETVQAAARLGKDNVATVILNPAPAPTEPLSPTIYKAVDILTPNESEARSLTGLSNLEEAAKKLLNWGVKVVVVTLGAGGVLVANGSDPVVHIPAFQVTPIDTVAAGDAFNGGLGVALAESKTIEEAVQFAQAAAAISVTRRGAQPSLPSCQEVFQFFLSTHTL